MRMITDTMFFDEGNDSRKSGLQNALRDSAMLHEAVPARQVTVLMSRVQHCCDSRLLFRRSGDRCEAFKVRHCFLARREADPEDAWRSYEIAQAILIAISNNQSFRPIFFAGRLYDRVAHT